MLKEKKRVKELRAGSQETERGSCVGDREENEVKGKSKEGRYGGRQSQQQRKKEMQRCQEIDGETVEVECHQQSSKNMSKKFKIGPQTAFLTCLLSYQAVKYCGVDLLINGLIR